MTKAGSARPIAAVPTWSPHGPGHARGAQTRERTAADRASGAPWSQWFRTGFRPRPAPDADLLPVGGAA